MVVSWETIQNNGSYGGEYRKRVPGGWIYRVVKSPKNYAAPESMCFVPDPCKCQENADRAPNHHVPSRSGTE